MTRSALLIATLLLVAGCAASESAGRPAEGSAAPVTSEADVGPILDACARIHGGAGPFVVAGYRMGARALRELGAQRGAWGLEVAHTCPRAVQWSCIADGLQASTGASVGRLSLTITFVEVEGRTESRVSMGGKSVTLGLTDTFLAHFLDTPMEGLAEAGERVARLPDDEIFWLRGD
jgi:formylmethanofuran dehydrogenase subunit E